MRKTWHQLDPVKMGQKALEKLPYREDVKGEKYENGAKYRSRTYPEEIFVWKAYPKGSDTKGEWQVGGVETE
jgi:hypothetical protein